MKDFLRAGLVLGLLFSGLGLGTASAQPTKLMFDIPFGFTVNGTTLPEGKYTIEKVGTFEFTLADQMGKIKVLFYADPLPQNNAMRNTASELIFDDYGDINYLNKLIFEGQEGYYVPMTSSERAMAKLQGQHRVPAIKK